MPDIRFGCPKCQGHLVVDSKGAGRVVSCPHCNESLTIPSPADVDGPAAPVSPPGNTCTKCGKRVILDKHEIVSQCDAAGIALTWGSLGPSLARGNMTATGINDIYSLLSHTSSSKAESFQSIVGAWASHGRCAACGEQWCHECASGPLPDNHMVQPPHCKCG